ncbi:tetratricopeptide repeat protein [Spirosoma endophyticum]|uniref:tetratricopeptide repeat protein n=1 Tax=Spirosoma endophyticum TaxID=662367 RepID=UPI0015A58FA2
MIYHHLKLYPYSTGAYFNRENVYFELGNLTAALQDYNMVLKINPTDNEAYTISQKKKWLQKRQKLPNPL